MQVAEGSIKGADAIRHTGVDHPRDSIVPEILLIERPVGLAFHGVGQHAVEWMPAAHTGRLHTARCGQIRRPQAQSVHARARGGDLFDVFHTLGCLQEGMQENWL